VSGTLFFWRSALRCGLCSLRQRVSGTVLFRGRKMKDLLIKVPERAHKGLLDRETVVASISRDLRPWCTLIEDIVSYGSNLIPRCFDSSDRGLKDAVVLAILLRQVVAMLDSVHLLLSQGACYVAQLPTRALFESSVYIDWILLSDPEKKSLYYYVHNLRRKRLWARRVQVGSAESKKFMDAINKSGIQVGEEVARQAQEQLTEIERLLSTSTFAAVSAEFDRFLNRRKYDPAWYVPLGPPNLRKLSEDVGKLTQYIIFYSTSSQAMHASSYEGHISIGKGEITFQPIRSLEGFGTVLNFSVAEALATYRRVLQEYRREELPAFSRKYLEKWQRDFLNVPHIKVKVDPIRI